jgi:hypothetical protein
MNEWMNEWMKDERTKEWPKKERINERMNEQMNEWVNKRMSEWMNERMNVILNKEWLRISTVLLVSACQAIIRAASPCLTLDLQWPLSIVFIQHFKIFFINVSETISIWTFRILWFMRSHSVTKHRCRHVPSTNSWLLIHWWADNKKSVGQI